MINFVLIEDEKDHAVLLNRLIAEAIPSLNNAGEAETVESGIKLIKKVSPDLVFLDIELAEGNAFQLLDKLMPVDFEIIFITAYSKYTLKAIHYSALDYLLKPVNSDELKAALKKVMERVHLKNLNERLKNLLHNVQRPQELYRIALPVKGGIDFVDINDLIRCESANNCTVIYTKSGKKYVSSRTTKEFEELLPDTKFFRVHHSEIVNISFVKKYYKEGRGGYLELLDGTIVPVAYRRKDDFLAKFGYT
jgi:two-component system LytT family response regulator